MLAYCAEDVRALEQLLPLMLLGLRLDEAVWRGRFSCAMAVIESNGVPLDAELARWISDNRDRIRRRAIAELDQWGFYRCQKAMLEDRRRERGQAIRRPHECSEACEQWFDTGAFVDWLEGLGIELERYRKTGNPILNRKTLEEYKDMYEDVAPAISLRNALSDLHANRLVVGPDGRNRTWLAPFGSITGRCQPSNSEYVFGLSRFYRNLIQAPPGRAVVYLDFAQQEFLIAAVLSQDDEMFTAYMRGDTYIGIGEAWGLITPDMTDRGSRRGSQADQGGGAGHPVPDGRQQAGQVHQAAAVAGGAVPAAAQGRVLEILEVVGRLRQLRPAQRRRHIGGELGSDRAPREGAHAPQFPDPDRWRRDTCARPAAWWSRPASSCAPRSTTRSWSSAGSTRSTRPSTRVKRLMIEATRLVLNDGRMLQVGDLSGDVRVDAKSYAHPTHFDEGRDSAVWELITRMREEDGYAAVQ